MKFKLLSLVIALLIFSMPCITLADTYFSMHPDVEQAVRAAKNDAAADTSRFIPFSIGCLVGGGLMLGTALAGTAIIESEYVSQHIIPPGSNTAFVDDRVPVALCLVGGLFGCIGGSGSIPTTVFAIYESSPPTKRLLGKSAEYVSAYTHAYTKKGKQIRTLWSGCGTITACVAIPYIMSRSETQF